MPLSPWRRSASVGAILPPAGSEPCSPLDRAEDPVLRARSAVQRLLPDTALATSPASTNWAPRAPKELHVSCDAADFTAPLVRLTGSTDLELCRQVERLLSNAGCKRKHLHQATKVVLRVLELGTASEPDPDATRRASELFVEFAERLRGRFVQMSEAELLASVSFLAEAVAEVARRRSSAARDMAAGATTTTDGGAMVETATKVSDAADAESTKQVARELRKQIRAQVDVLTLEFEYDPLPVEEECSAAKIELQRIRDLAIAEAKLEPNKSKLRRFVADFSAMESKLRGQISRAQERVKELISERQDQMDYLHDMLEQQLSHLKREKDLAQQRNMDMLPRAVARICMGPNLVKSKGKLILGPPPDADKIKKTQEVFESALGLHGVRAEDVSITSVYKVLNYIDVHVAGYESVQGVYETLDRLFKAEEDTLGIRAVCAAFCHLETLHVSPTRPMERVRSDLEARFEYGPRASAEFLKQLEAEVASCSAAGRAVWELPPEEPSASEEATVESSPGAVAPEPPRSRESTPRSRPLTAAETPEVAETPAAEYVAKIETDAKVISEAEARQKLIDYPSRPPEEPPLPAPREEFMTRGPFQALRQAAPSPAALMLDAEEAQRRLKEILAPGTAWAKAVFDEETKLDDPSRVWNAPPRHSQLAGGHHWDPGVKLIKHVEDTVAAIREHEDDDAYRSVLDVSRLSVAFKACSQLLDALRWAEEALDIVSIENGFRNPTVMGFRSFRLIVRQSVLVAGDAASVAPVQRVHFSELRLTLQRMDNFRYTTGKESLEKLAALLAHEKGMLPRADVAGRVRRAALETLETTHGRAMRRGAVRFYLHRPLLRIPHDERG